MTFSHQFYFSNISSDRLKTSTYFKNLTDQNTEKKKTIKKAKINASFKGFFLIEHD